MENLHTNITIEQLQGMMADLIVSQRETDRKFQDTDQKFQNIENLLSFNFHCSEKIYQRTDNQIQAMLQEFGYRKSEKEVAEDFFYTILTKTMSLENLQFDFIDMNIRRKRNNTEAEYDIILYNHYKVLVIEVKYNFRIDQLRTFYDKRLKKFRTLFPEYKDYKLFGGIAALSYEKDVIEEAKRFGFYILTQNNESIKLANETDFEPNEIK